jgi:Na+-transporting NADH:ubiquinone oxidoreductase subunit NqrD
MPTRDSTARTIATEARRLVDAIACVAVAFGVAALVGLDAISGPTEFVLTALAGGAAYGALLLIIGAVRGKLGAAGRHGEE